MFDTVELARLSDAELIAASERFEYLQWWAEARQAKLLAEFARRVRSGTWTGARSAAAPPTG